jgi:branched-subunit amino acid transport protein
MDVYLIVLVMTAVTYIPRLAPFLFFKTESINPEFKRFLSYIPYAALGALILPGSISAVGGKSAVSAIAILVTALTAWFNGSIIVSVTVSVAAVYFMLAAGF